MNLEFHYYIVYILCKQAGFDDNDSHIVSYSSQYIDNKLISYQVDLGSQIYKTIPTQNYGWWDDYYPKNVYVPFHFLPGDENHPAAERWDGKKNRFNCTPDSPRAKELLIRGLKTKNLYRVGIAIHTYADTWAHQNFSGLNEPWNVVEDTSLIPNIGHAQVLGAPDSVSGIWADARLKNNRIINKQRFLDAARKIYKYLCTYNRRSFEDHDLIVANIDYLISGSGYPTTREERIANYIIEENISEYNKYEWISQAVHFNDYDMQDKNGFVTYNKLLWLKDALLYKSKLSAKPVLKPKEYFFESHWYKWNEAAKEHLKEAQSLLQDLW